MHPDYPMKCGLQEISSESEIVRVFAYTQIGLWCWSNAGIIWDVQRDELTFVDVLTDIKQTRAMLAAMKQVAPDAKYKNLIYTHCDIDHIAGQQLIYDEVENIYAREGCKAAMKGFYKSNFGVTMNVLHHIWHMLLKPLVNTQVLQILPRERIPDSVAKLIAKISSVQFFESFDWHNVDYSNSDRAPNTVVQESVIQLELGRLGLKKIEIIPVAVDSHSNHDLIVRLPSANVVFTGDILFHGMTPVNWAGTFENSIDASQLVASKSNGYTVVVPGHGAITKVGAFKKMEEYWKMLEAEYEDCKRKELSPQTCARAVLETMPEKFKSWPDSERAVINILVQYHFDASPSPSKTKLDKFEFIAEYAYAKLFL